MSSEPLPSTRPAEAPPAPRFHVFDGIGNYLFVGLAAVAYLTMFIDGWTEWSGEQKLLVLTLGAVFVVLGIICPAHPWLERFPFTSRNVIYYALMLTLFVAIALASDGANGFWLLVMPVVGQAAGDLSLRGLIAVSVATLGAWAGLVSYWSDGDLIAILNNVLIFIPAIAFTAGVTLVARREEASRQRQEQLSAELAGANQQLRTYAVQVEELATTKERNRVAREIHDSLGHYLTVVNVQLEAARTVLDSDPGRAADALSKAQQLTQEGLAEIRRSVAALRESPLDNRTLPEAVSALVAESCAAGIVTELDVHGVLRALSPQQELTLYRAAQEGLTNVRKHAHASRADLRLAYEEDAVRLSIQDNGVGAASPANGFGLLGLRERVELLGGRVRVETVAGRGFTLAVEVPYPGRA